MFDLDFPKADPVPRGCGEREPGGVYAESGLSPRGRPLEEFLFDPPLPLPDGLDLVNKPQLWQRTFASGEPALGEDGLAIFDLLIWVGAEHYPYCPDYLEEVRRYGASRRLNPNLDLSLLCRSSRMILAHPHVLNTRWHEQRPPETCQKRVPGHEAAAASQEEAEDAQEEAGDGRVSPRQSQHDTGGRTELVPETVKPGGWNTVSQHDTGGRTQLVPLTPLPEVPLIGPCLFKLWNLIPREAAQTVIEAAEREAARGGEGQPGAALQPLCLRQIGSTIYQYRPTGESPDGLVPGLFAALPLTGFALVRFQDGSVNERAREKMQAAWEQREGRALPFYESDR